jgi:hypothetical protein
MKKTIEGVDEDTVFKTISPVNGLKEYDRMVAIPARRPDKMVSGIWPEHSSMMKPAPCRNSSLRSLKPLKDPGNPGFSGTG